MEGREREAAPMIGRPRDDATLTPTRSRDIYQRMLGTRDRVARETASESSGNRYMVDAIRNDPMISPDVLNITSQDRVIFAVFVLLGHLVTLYLTEWMIATSAVRTYSMAMFVMAFLYTLLLAMLVAAVNMSDGDLRIVFNYVNLMTGNTRLLAHAGLLWLTMFIVSLTLSTVSASGRTVAVTDADRLALMHKVETTSTVVWYTLAFVGFLF